MKKFVLVLAITALSGCADINPFSTHVVLIRDGAMKTSGVGSANGYCYVAWYKGIERIIMRRNGHAYDPPFEYRWELLKIGGSTRDVDQAWFDANCKEPAHD
jgi:hypothetical protein